MKRICRWTIYLFAVFSAWYISTFGRFNGRTLLMDAAAVGLVPGVHVLVLLGANVNDQDIGYWNGWTPLAFAAQGGNRRTVQALLARGGDPNWGGWRNIPREPDKGGNPLPEELRPLCRAVGSQAATVKLVEILVDHGARIEAPEAGFSALGCLSHEGQRAGKARYLIARGASPNALFNRTSIPVLVAYAGAGYTDVAEVLLNAGADINAVGPRGRTALEEAQVNRRDETVRFLLARAGKTSPTAGQQ